jgi:putative restriction endonuclease
MKFYLGVTDNNWFSYLRNISPEDINFWQPGGKTNFRILSPGAPFLFKLKHPYNVIGGVAFFSSQTFLPIKIAWDVFRVRNGCASFEEFKRMILQYRSDKTTINPTIGCIVLSNPIFFEESDWIDVPEDWSKSIVQGKSYETTTPEGMALWSRVENLLYPRLDSNPEKDNQFTIGEDQAKYGRPTLRKVRLGQGAFRVLVTDAYGRRCSISGEKTLPVLEAAHIKAYAESGPHAIANGLLLRSDMHKLFDSGYITITKDYRIEISKRIKEEFENGKEYYQYHGRELLYLPDNYSNRPHESYVEWHNQKFER